MRFEQLLGASAVAAGVTSAFPFNRAANVTGNAKFTVPQGPPKLEGRKIAGPIALARVYGKYMSIGASAPAIVENAASKAAASDDGTVAANPQQYDSEYLSPVTIGGQTLNLDFDTGSSDLWVFSTELPTANQNGHNVYNPASSSTSQELSGETWKISYGDGSSASGNVYTDTVDVGGTTVTGQAVELAQQISSEFAQDQGDGLLGLAFSSINTVTPDQQQTFFANAESLLDSALFTADLKKGAPGTYEFGFIDDSAYTGDITYTSVDNSQGFWGFTSNGYGVGGSSFTSSSISAIADTGTSLLVLPDDVVDAYYAQVSGSSNSQSDGGYIFSCDTTLPDLTLGIEGYQAVVPGTYLNYAPASEDGSCFGGLQSNTGVGISIFGDVFLKSQFVVFDDSQSSPRLGFAAKNL